MTDRLKAKLAERPRGSPYSYSYYQNIKQMHYCISEWITEIILTINDLEDAGMMIPSLFKLACLANAEGGWIYEGGLLLL